MPARTSERTIKKFMGVGKAIENVGGNIPLPKDSFSHNLNDKASPKPLRSAIEVPLFKLDKGIDIKTNSR